MGLNEDSMMDVKIGMNLEQRKVVCEALKRLQADTAVCYGKTHGFHWNITGPHFASMHKLLEEQYQEVWTAIDEIAERIRALGEYALTSYEQYRELSDIKEETGHPSWEEMIRQLVDANEIVARTAKGSFEVIEKSGDEATLDLLNSRTLQHEKNAWMLRSMLE
jgi:starvation-inducible DNA-binding protein